MDPASPPLNSGLSRPSSSITKLCRRNPLLTNVTTASVLAGRGTAHDHAAPGKDCRGASGDGWGPQEVSAVHAIGDCVGWGRRGHCCLRSLITDGLKAVTHGSLHATDEGLTMVLRMRAISVGSWRFALGARPRTGTRSVLTMDGLRRLGRLRLSCPARGRFGGVGRVRSPPGGPDDDPTGLPGDSRV